MSWLSFTIIAQILNSVVAVLDKYLVTSKRVTTPILYVFYTGVLTILGILLYVPSLFKPDIYLPKFSNIEGVSLFVLGIIICASVLQLFALWALFSSFKRNDASDVVPVVGSISAIFSFIIGYVFFGASLTPTFTVGFTLLVFGTFLISHLRFNKKVFLFTIVSGFCFGLYNLLLKEILLEVGFETGFFWLSSITCILSCFLLFFKKIRDTFHVQRKEKHIKTTIHILVSNKIVAGIAGILLIKAIELGEVSLVQALGGMQFVFLFLFAAILGPLTPIDFGENIKRKDVYLKLIAISIIVSGFVLLFI